MFNSKGSILILTSLLVISLQAMGDDDEHEGKRNRADVAPVNNAAYAEECGACHFAYPPGLLPTRSWEKLMSRLDDHFGENAELSADIVKTLTVYMITNSADHSTFRRSKQIADSVKKGSTPLRITETPFVKREHRELSERLVQDNPQVKSLSRCDACHTNAAKGSFDEDEINIPGHGRIED